MARTLAAVAARLGAELHGADHAFGDVSTDTRQLEAGALFVAIAGPRFDGNDYVGDAHGKGAVGALVSRLAAVPLPQVLVRDTRLGLGGMARAWRENFAIPVVAVTGSSGKTTVKALVGGILEVAHRACVTRGSLNNEIGVPLTLMRLTSEHDAGVFELGANHAGEIAYLSSLVQPTVGVITNAAAAHLEGFGSLDGVAAAKGELLDALPRAGTSILNADDPYFDEWRGRARTEYVVSFGFGAHADCSVLGEPSSTATGSAFTMRLPDGETIAVELPLLGRQNIANALAAAAAASAAGADAEQIRIGLGRAEAVRGRMHVLAGLGGARIVDDSYNANPGSARAALDYLGTLGGRRILVLGDMAELGPDAVRLHREIGAYARTCCDALYGVGALGAEAARAFGGAGRAFDDIEPVRRALLEVVDADLTVLIKGSRVMGLEALVGSLIAPAGGGEARC